jgi:hypothetical protein
MPARTEVLGDRTIGGKEPLSVAGGLEPLHASLPLTRRLMRILRPIIEIPVLAMFHTRKNLALSRSVALQFVGDDYPRHVRQPFEQLAEELLRSPLIPPTLHQDVEYVPVLINCPPEIMPLAFDGQKHLIPIPLVTEPRPSPPELVGILLAKLAALFADRLIRHNHTAFQ